MGTGIPTPADRVDAARAVVLPGSGAALRLPGLLCLLCLPDPRPGQAVDGAGHLARLVEICTQNCVANPGTPGRPLARRLARWLGSLDPGPDFGTIAATETGIAIFLHGAVDAVLGGQRYSAVESGAWLDQGLPYPDGSLTLLPTDRPTPDNAVRAVFDLRGGVVPAGAVLLVPRSGAVPAPMPPPASAAAGSATGEAAGEAGEGRPQRVEPEAGPVTPKPVTPRLVSTILGVAPDGPVRAPLADGPARPATALRPFPRARADDPDATPGPAGAPDEEPGARLAVDEPPTVPGAARAATNGAPTAYGYRCSREHLNDPRNQFCVVCGIRMAERTGRIEVGVRPPLGLLVFDDGSTYVVDADYLLGRMPESDPRVLGGELRALPVDDPEAQLSRGHLVIKLDGWDVTAIDESRNGTLVARSAEESWSRLTPRRPLRLLPGTRVRVGGRSFVFESPSSVR